MSDRGTGEDAPVLLREVTLRRQPELTAPGRQPVLVVRVWAHRGEAGQWFELRGEDPSGNLRFSYRDARRLDVLAEFEHTVGELLEEYAPAAEARAVHG